MAQLRTAPPRWLCHRGLWPCAPGHFGFLHKKPERFHIQNIRWLEVPLPHTDYYLTWNILWLEFPQFRLRTRNILRLKVPQFRSRIQNSVWLEALKLRNSASAQGIYCGLEVSQFRFHTINEVRLEVSQFHFHTRALTLNPVVPPPHKEYSMTWSSAVLFPHKEYTMSRSSAVLLSQTEQSVTWSSAVLHNILGLEVLQYRFHKNRHHLKFRTSAPAREHYFSLENPLLFNHPPTHFLIFVLSYVNDGPSEDPLLAKVIANVFAARGISWWHIMFILTQFATEQPGMPRATTAKMGHFYYVDTFTSTFLDGDGICQTLWIICRFMWLFRSVPHSTNSLDDVLRPRAISFLHYFYT